MKKTTQTAKEGFQNEWDRHKNSETIRDPHISLYFLQKFNTIGDLTEGKPEVRIIHCPSDEESFFLKEPLK